jgi:hypothetical protein
MKQREEKDSGALPQASINKKRQTMVLEKQ